MNDAVAITGAANPAFIASDMLFIKQFRKKKRALHEAAARKGRAAKNKTAKRNGKNTLFRYGLYLNDKVLIFGLAGYISGFTRGGVYVKTIDGGYITMDGKSYKQLPYRGIEPKWATPTTQ